MTPTIRKPSQLKRLTHPRIYAAGVEREAEEVQGMVLGAWYRGLAFQDLMAVGLWVFGFRIVGWCECVDCVVEVLRLAVSRISVMSLKE